jgi:hypothetical protein
MSKLLRKPVGTQRLDVKGKFEKFNLEENPFPSDPFVNKDSTDKRVNGDIYEVEIRKKEYEKIENNFLKNPQANLNHVRLGYIVDDSYIGRGNGKSAFLVNLQHIVNREFCLDVSNGLNKCFAVYVTPEAGGRTKTFSSFVDQIYSAIYHLGIIEDCLAILRLEAVSALYPHADLQSPDWYKSKEFDLLSISDHISRNEFLQELPPNFPLLKGRSSLIKPFITQEHFKDYYLSELKKGKQRYDFLFSHLVQFFQAAGFNGAYILIDDFERIPDFQSERQKRDFAFELRSCLFDGLYTNAKLGFYNFILVLHAGVQRLISSAWTLSGMENRAPISPPIDSQHVIAFEKLSRDHASLLLKKYLSEYRIDKTGDDSLFPFTNDAVSLIGEMSEYNAAKILKTSYELLEKAATEDQKIIDGEFVSANKGGLEITPDKGAPAIEDAESKDLMKKARETE